MSLKPRQDQAAVRSGFPDALILDFYRTLTTCPYDRLRSLASSLAMPPNMLVEAMIPGRDGQGKAWMELERGLLSGEKFWEEACIFAYEQCGVQADADQVMQKFISVEVPDLVITLLRRLQLQEVPVCILTNGFRPGDGVLAPLDLLATVSHSLVESHAVGYRKPDAEIFDLTLHRLNVSRRQVLYVDDTPFFVQQARKQDISSVCIDSVDDTVAILQVLVER